VAQDYAKAREWSEKAAEKGTLGAMFNLGLFYRDGSGVRRTTPRLASGFQKSC